MTNAIVLLDQDQSIQSVKLLAAIVHKLKDEVFQEGADYGVIPGTGTKPVLLLPGMEKLMRALRLRPEYVARQQIIDFDKPLFFFQYECRLIEIDTGIVVSSAIGSANSQESKWRWRSAERVCPLCGEATIKKSKYPPKGTPKGTLPGWYCYAKIGGCGAEFRHDDPAIVDQEVGRIENPDPADQLNTIDKIAQKRALGSSIKGAANVSELFTVDLDDLVPARPLTGDEAKRLVANFPGLTADDFRAALGGPSSNWKRGYPAADRAIAEWKRTHKPRRVDEVIDAEFTVEAQAHHDAVDEAEAKAALEAERDAELAYLDAMSRDE